MVALNAHSFTRTLVAVGLALGIAGCGGDDDGGGDTGLAADLAAAITAVEAELGDGQEYFEVTAQRPFTNVFVAADGGTSAIPYVFLDDELQAPAPVLSGATGNRFTAEQVDFDEDTILAQVADELPDATIEALSVEGGADGTVRYVVMVRSEAGGLLDVTVSPDGAVLAVDPV